MNLLTRMWINQPSTLQPHHALHCTNVLAAPIRPNVHIVYFLDGPIVSCEVASCALSKGWIPHTTTRGDRHA